MRYRELRSRSWPARTESIPRSCTAGTVGNPFFVTEVLAAGGEEVPESVRDAVLARAARLSAPARGVLDAVAVIPGQLELWLLEAVSARIELTG